MKNIWTIAKKEFDLYVGNPVAYVVAFIIMLILGIIFFANMQIAFYQNYAPTAQVIIAPLVSLILFSTPAITMRTIADEHRTGTLETLLTAPVRDWELVTGKWLGSLLFYLCVIATTLLFPLILGFFVQPGIDLGLAGAGYLGIILLTGVFLAIGVFISSLFSNQSAAFFATLGVFLVFWLIGYPAELAGGPVSSVLQYIDLSKHFYSSFIIGTVELKDVVYYISVIVAFLFLGSVSTESRRWR